jgi:hypothetical protein
MFFRQIVPKPISANGRMFSVLRRDAGQTQASIRSPPTTISASEIKSPATLNSAVWLNKLVSVFENKARFTKAIVQPLFVEILSLRI